MAKRKRSIASQSLRHLTPSIQTADEASFRLLFMNNPQPMWVYALKTLELMEVNEAATQHYGY